MLAGRSCLYVQWDLKPEARKAISEVALRMGKSPDDYLRELAEEVASAETARLVAARQIKRLARVY